MLFESVLVWELKIKLVLLWNWFFFGPKSQPFNSETKLFESLLFKDHLYYIIFFAEWSCNIMSTNFTLHVVDLEKYGIKIVFLTNLSCRYVSLNTKKIQKTSAKYSFPTFRHPCAKKVKLCYKVSAFEQKLKAAGRGLNYFRPFPIQIYEIFQKTVP